MDDIGAEAVPVREKKKGLDHLPHMPPARNSFALAIGLNSGMSDIVVDMGGGCQ
jgi:hypothetical protein